MKTFKIVPGFFDALGVCCWIDGSVAVKCSEVVL